MKRFAFTLAEVLITLGIIGIVAALTMPTLIAHYKAKVLEAQFKKSYSTLTNATKMLVQQDVSPYDLTTVAERVEAYSKVLNASKCTTNYCSGKWNNLAGNKGLQVNIINRTALNLNDGSLVLFGPVDPVYNWIVVDINGPKKGPNRAGHDLHIFKIMQNNNLIPLSSGHDTRRCSIKSMDQWGADSYFGYGCTGYALMNKNPDGDGEYWYDF